MRSIWCWFAVGIFLVATSVATAQEQQGGQRPRGPRNFGLGGGGFGFIGGGGSDNGMWLLRMDQVQKELELVGEQKDKLIKIAENTASKMRELYSGLRDLSAEDRAARFAELREKTTKLTEDARKQVDEVLLPNQRDRLKQIGLQMRLRGSTSAALANKALTDALNLTDEQIEKLRQTEQEANEELTKKTEELRKEVHEKVLSVLTPEQREKLKSMLGDQFDFQSQFGQRRLQLRQAQPQR